MEEKPNYYAVIPANVRYDNELRANEKLLYGEITALAKNTGECWASNKYFSELYGVQPNAIAIWLRHLKNKNYIFINYEYQGKEIQKRIIRIGDIQKDTTSYSKRYEGDIQKGEDNNKNINNKENNNNKLLLQKKVFKKPTLSEVQAYCIERNNTVDAEYFIDYYESKGWLVGKTKMKDWKAAVRLWEKKNTKKIDKQKEFDEMCKRLAYLDEEE